MIGRADGFPGPVVGRSHLVDQQEGIRLLDGGRGEGTANGEAGTFPLPVGGDDAHHLSLDSLLAHEWAPGLGLGNALAGLDARLPFVEVIPAAVRGRLPGRTLPPSTGSVPSPACETSTRSVKTGCPTTVRSRRGAGKPARCSPTGRVGRHSAGTR